VPYLFFVGALICTILSVDHNTGTIGMAACGLWIVFAILQVHKSKLKQEQLAALRKSGDALDTLAERALRRHQEGKSIPKGIDEL